MKWRRIVLLYFTFFCVCIGCGDIKPINTEAIQYYFDPPFEFISPLKLTPYQSNEYIAVSVTKIINTKEEWDKVFKSETLRSIATPLLSWDAYISHTYYFFQERLAVHIVLENTCESNISIKEILPLMTGVPLARSGIESEIQTYRSELKKASIKFSNNITLYNVISQSIERLEVISNNIQKRFPIILNPKKNWNGMFVFPLLPVSLDDSGILIIGEDLKTHEGFSLFINIVEGKSKV